MKYVIIIADGMSDLKLPQLNDKTPMEYAKKPTMDYLAKHGTQFLVRTTPDGMYPGSDVCNLSILSYDPKACYTGRSPLEAASIGVTLKDSETSFRVNFVTLKNEKLIDYSAGEITSAEGAELISALEKNLGRAGFKFFAGTSYRNLLVWDNAPDIAELTPPHEITGGDYCEYLPKDEVLRNTILESMKVLECHPVNLDRIQRGLKPANAIWIWGAGKAAKLQDFGERWGLRGAAVSAVDLIKGIAKLSGLTVMDVPGATGNIHTNYKGKAEAVIKALETHDFVYVHVEAPDECGHQGDLDGKIKSIELIDEFVVKPIFESMEGDYKIIILPDHPTPVMKMTHSSDAVPCVIYDSRNTKSVNDHHIFSEYCAKDLSFAPGYMLLSRVFIN